MRAAGIVGPILARMAIAMHVGLEILDDASWWNVLMISALASDLPISHLRAVLE